MNSKFLNLGLSVLVASVLIGCGSSDDSAETIVNGILDEVPNILVPETVVPTVSYSCDKTNTNHGKTFTNKLGADGKLAVVCESSGYLTFADNLNELAITQVTSKSVIATNSSKEGSVAATADTDLSAGTVHYVGTSSVYGSFDCIETYDIGNLPKTIYDAGNISSFFYLDDFQKISDTCPEWMDNDDDNDDSDTGTVTLNATITDSAGETSHVALYTKY